MNEKKKLTKTQQSNRLTWIFSLVKKAGAQKKKVCNTNAGIKNTIKEVLIKLRSTILKSSNCVNTKSKENR